MWVWLSSPKHNSQPDRQTDRQTRVFWSGVRPPESVTAVCPWGHIRLRAIATALQSKIFNPITRQKRTNLD